MRLWWGISSWGSKNSVPLLLAVGLALRLLGLADPLWYDEAFTAHLARLPLDRMFAAIVGDVHPPLWYVIEWVIVQLVGASELTLRLPALVLGMGNLAGIYALAKKLLGRQVGAVALAGAVFSPFLIYYSQDARMYQLLLGGLLLALGGGFAGRWWLFGLGSLVALYSQNLAAPLLAVVVIAVLMYRGRCALWPMFGTAMGIGILWFPGLLLAIYQMGNIAQGFWIPRLTVGTALVGLDAMLWVLVPNWLQPHAMLLTIVVLAVVVGISVSGLRAGALRRPLLVALVLAGGPVISMIIPSLAWRSVFLSRALIASLAGLLPLGGYVWQQFGRQGKRATLALLVPFVALSLYNQYAPGSGRDKHGNARNMAAQIRTQWQEGDAIYHVSLASYIGLAYYLPGVPHYVLPQAGDLSQSLSDQTKHAMGIPLHAACSVSWTRLWLIEVRNPYSSRAEIEAADQLLGRYRQVGVIPVEDNRLVTANIFVLARDGQPVTAAPTTATPKRG